MCWKCSWGDTQFCDLCGEYEDYRYSEDLAKNTWSYFLEGLMGQKDPDYLKEDRRTEWHVCDKCMEENEDVLKGVRKQFQKLMDNKPPFKGLSKSE
jgi:hypothetical protein